MSWMPEEKWYEALPSAIYFLFLLVAIALCFGLLVAILA